MQIYVHVLLGYFKYPPTLTVIVQKQSPGCSVKKVFSKILQNLQENTCVTVSFSKTLQA